MLKNLERTTTWSDPKYSLNESVSLWCVSACLSRINKMCTSPWFRINWMIFTPIDRLVLVACPFVHHTTAINGSAIHSNMLRVIVYPALNTVQLSFQEIPTERYRVLQQQQQLHSIQPADPSSAPPPEPLWGSWNREKVCTTLDSMMLT